jgi:hypothetical protein
MVSFGEKEFGKVGADEAVGSGDEVVQGLRFKV